MSFKAFTVVAFVAAIGLDLFTSLILLELGFVETNLLYRLMGPWFWGLYLFVNAGLLILLLVASERWWWMHLILWIATAAHLICGVHNLGLM